MKQLWPKSPTTGVDYHCLVADCRRQLTNCVIDRGGRTTNNDMKWMSHPPFIYYFQSRMSWTGVRTIPPCHPPPYACSTTRCCDFLPNISLHGTSQSTFEVPANRLKIVRVRLLDHLIVWQVIRTSSSLDRPVQAVRHLRWVTHHSPGWSTLIAQTNPKPSIFLRMANAS